MGLNFRMAYCGDQVLAILCNRDMVTSWVMREAGIVGAEADDLSGSGGSHPSMTCYLLSSVL